MCDVMWTLRLTATRQHDNTTTQRRAVTTVIVLFFFHTFTSEVSSQYLQYIRSIYRVERKGIPKGISMGNPDFEVKVTLQQYIYSYISSYIYIVSIIYINRLLPRGVAVRCCAALFSECINIRIF